MQYKSCILLTGMKPLHRFLTFLQSPWKRNGGSELLADSPEAYYDINQGVMMYNKRHSLYFRFNKPLNGWDRWGCFQGFHTWWNSKFSCFLRPLQKNFYLMRWSSGSRVPAPSRRLPGPQSGHHDWRSPPPDGLRQHDGEPVLPVDFLQAAHQNHELRLAQIRSGRELGKAWVDGWRRGWGEWMDGWKVIGCYLIIVKKLETVCG